MTMRGELRGTKCDVAWDANLKPGRWVAWEEVELQVDGAVSVPKGHADAGLESLFVAWALADAVHGAPSPPSIRGCAIL